MELFPIDWLARDVDQPDGAAQYTITVFGKTPDARSVAAHITFYPYMYVQLPAGAGQGQARLFITEAVTKHRAIAKYCRVVERVSLWGFTNMTKVPLAQLAFPTMKKMRWAARTYQGAGLTTYESGVDPLLRFFHIRGISPVTWIAIADTTPVDEDDKTTRAALEVTASFDRVSTSARTERPPLVIASWDLETHAAKRPDGSRKFPCADNDDDVIIQVATSFQRYGEAQPYRTLIMAYMPTDPVEGVDVVAFDDEADMINAWCDQLAAEDVDILIGYNTDQVSRTRTPGCPQ
jgi:DNA polymerase delta subunit 1